MLENISINELRFINSNNIIDIRDKEKYNQGHINGARNIPFMALLTNCEKYLVKSEKYYIYCQKGIRSSKICQALFNKGYNVVNVSGGYDSLRAVD